MVDVFDNYSGKIYVNDKDVCMQKMWLNICCYQENILLYDYCMTR